MEEGDETVLAQLLKLEDYISRYEIDPYRYSSQFIRMKKKQWEEIKSQFEQAMATEEDKLGLIDNAKQAFLDKIFLSQLVWASSTIRQISELDQRYKQDSLLKYFLQSFPDNCFLMYFPVFQIKKASVQGEMIFIRPTDIVCLTALEGEEDNVLIGGKGNFWLERNSRGERKIVAPTIALERTEKIVHSILRENGLHLPIRKTLLNRKGFIHAHELSREWECVDKRNYDSWFQKMRHQPSPVKYLQLKAAKVLMASCKTEAVDR